MDVNPKRCRLNRHESYEATHVDLLSGNVSYTPNRMLSEVRLFVSSAAKDFEVERNYLLECVYDELRISCLEKYQKDLVLIDLSWGVTEELISETRAVELSFHEIKKCQKDSIGPAFVAFLGSRYGVRHFKPTIECDEFKALKKAVKKASNKEMMRALDYCYDFDSNSQKYKLSALRTDKWEWKMYEEKLLKSVRKAVESFPKSAKVSRTQKDSYLTSIIEQEIYLGILTERNSSLKSIAFFRECENPSAATETDLEIKVLLNELKHQVKKKLNAPNKYAYQVDMIKVEDFREPFNESAKEYLQKFGEDFTFTVRLLIQWNIEASGTLKDDPEVSNHVKFCVYLHKHYISRSNYLRKVKYYLEEELYNKPLIIAGEAGSGKTSLLAEIRYFIQVTVPDSIVLIRFMGTTRESSTMRSVYISLIHHLNAIFKKDIKLDITERENVFELRQVFLRQLSALADLYPTKRFFFLLDSIDALAERDYSLDWMMHELPLNFKVIFTVRLKQGRLYERLKGQFDCIVLNRLDPKEAKVLFDMLLTQAQYKLTQNQLNSVTSLLNLVVDIYPFHVKLLFDIASKWTSSYIPPDKFMNCTTAHETIKHLFQHYETQFGDVVFSRCVFYLTLFEYCGITDAEMQDLLSIDDEVLNAVFQEHHPAAVRRFPISLWLNVKYELKEYLIEREVDGVVVTAWLNRVFIEVAKEFYVSHFERSSFKDRLLMNTIEYYSERWNKIKSNGMPGNMKPFEFKKKKLNTFESKQYGKRVEYTAYRNTRAQRLRFKQKLENREVMVYNERHLNELLRVIDMLQDSLQKVELLKELIYFNADFMQAKAELHDLDFLIEADRTLSIHQAKYPEETRELVEINRIYIDNYRRIEKNPRSLPIEILSRFSSRSEYVRQFSSMFGLMPVHTYAAKTNTRPVFKAFNDNCLVNYYFLYNGAYVLLENATRADSITSVCLVKTNNGELIGQLDFEMKAESLQILVYDDYRPSIECMSDLRGFVYFCYIGHVYSLSFQGEVLTLAKVSEEIQQIFLLHSNFMLAILQSSLILLDLKANQKLAAVQQRITVEDEIVSVKLNRKHDDEVFMAKKIDQIEEIMVFVALKNMKINIFQYKLKNYRFSLFCQITDLLWDPYRVFISMNDYMIGWRESLIIDESSLVDVDKELVGPKTARFAVEGDGLVIIVEIVNYGVFKITDRIDKSSFGEMYDDDEKIELVKFFNNKIILGYTKNLNTSVYVFDVGNKNFVKLNGLVNAYHVDYLQQSSLLSIAQPNELSLFEIRETSVREVARVKTRASVIKVMNEKLYGIINGGQVLKEIEYLRGETKPPHRVNKILAQIDEYHVLVDMSQTTNSNTQVLAVLNVVTQKRVKSVVTTKEFSLLTINKRFMVLYDRSESFLYIYRITSDQVRSLLLDIIDSTLFCFEDEFEMELVLKDSVDNGVNSAKPIVDTCFFQSDFLYVQFYNLNKDHFEIIRLLDEHTDRFIVSLQEVDIDRSKVSCALTLANRHLVLWGEGSWMYYFDVVQSQLLVKTQLFESGFVECVCCIANTDDLLVKHQSSVYSVMYNKYTKELRTQKIKEIHTDQFEIHVERELLVTRILNNSFFEVYRVEQFLKNMRADLTLTNVNIETYLFSSDLKYLIVFNTENELSLYRMKKGVSKTAAFLYLNHQLENIHSSGRYITGENGGQMLSYEIIVDD